MFDWVHGIPILSIICYLPLAGALFVVFFMKNATSIRNFATLVAAVDFVISIPLWFAFDRDGEIFQFRPPWHYPYVWTVIVFPLSLLVAAVAGLIAPRSGPLRGLVLVNMAVLYGALALPSAPMHDGIRLFLPLFPFYAVVAGAGGFFAPLIREFLAALGITAAFVVFPLAALLAGLVDPWSSSLDQSLSTLSDNIGRSMAKQDYEFAASASACSMQSIWRHARPRATTGERRSANG